MTLDHVINKRKQRWEQFYRGVSPHVLFIVYIQETTPDRPFPYPEHKQARIEWAWEKYSRMMDQLHWLEDDSIPYLDVYTGTEIFAEAFGCKVYRSGEEMPFALPLVSTPAEASRIEVPEIQKSSLSELFEMADRLVERAGPGSLMRMVDIQSPMDIAALIWDKNTFYSAMIEYPQAILELARKVEILLYNFLDTWFERYGKEFIAHYPDYYMPYGITLSEDEIGAVNQAMFEKFFLPELTSLAQRYGSIGVHCCANARHQWEGLKGIPNLRLINFVQPEKVLLQAFEYFAPVCAQMHVWSGDGDPWNWAEKFPVNARVVMSVETETKKQAIEASKRIKGRIEE